MLPDQRNPEIFSSSPSVTSIFCVCRDFSCLLPQKSWMWMWISDLCLFAISCLAHIFSFLFSEKLQTWNILSSTMLRIIKYLFSWIIFYFWVSNLVISTFIPAACTLKLSFPNVKPNPGKALDHRKRNI